MARSGFRSLLIIVAVLVVVGIGGFIFREYLVNSANFIEPFQTTSPTATKKVYIAMDKSEWKLTLVREVIHQLQDTVNFRVENLTTLPLIKLNEWDAVLIVAPLYMATLQADAATFAQSAPDKGKLLLLATAGKTEIKVEGVDSITSASTETAETAVKVTQKLQKILGL